MNLTDVLTNKYKVVFASCGGKTETIEMDFENDNKVEQFKQAYNSISNLGKVVYAYRIAKIGASTSLVEDSFVTIKFLYETTDNKAYNQKIPFLPTNVKQSEIEMLASYLHNFKQIDLTMDKTKVNAIYSD